MLLHFPIWLLLIIPLAAAMWLWRLPSRLLRALRLAALVLVVLAMCGLAIKLPSRTGTLVVVADRSESMPPGVDASHKEAINLIQDAIGSQQRLAVVSFGRTAAVEQPPQSGEFAGFTGEIGRDESNLADAIERALSLIPADAPGRILILSDGRWTGRDPAAAASRAAARGISIDYRLTERAAANDVAISQIDAPTTVTPGESFMITAWIRSPIQQDVTFELVRGGERLAAGKTSVTSGLNRLTFRDQASEPGASSYTLRVTSGDDPVPENNTARLLVGIQGPKPILCITASADSGLVRLLEAGGLKVKSSAPEAMTWSLDELANYSAVLIENVPADRIGERGMENIAAWVKETGAGLMMTGGKNAYGPGGYFRSKLEPIMPVSMELRQEHRKLAMAIVVAMDRSGSMAMSAGGGRTKMDLANLAAVQVLDLLTPMDEFGVIAVDSTPHVIVKLAPTSDAGRVRGDILRIDSGGGGIFIYEALAASARMMLDAKAGTRHIILFADAADSEEPGAYKELIAKCQQAGITISVVGLGKPTDQDAELLRDIAQRGGGRCFFTENPEELPRLFAQDTFVVARSTFIDEATPIQFTGGVIGLTGKRLEGAPPVGGYNLCYLRPEANLAALTVDDYKAPVIAAWQAGAGRGLCYTGEADGAYAGPIAKWNQAGEMFTSLARWSAGDVNTLAGGLLVTQEVRNGISVVRLHLDPEREAEPFADTPTVTTLRGVPGLTPEVEKRELRWTSADTLEVEVPLRGGETSLSTIEVAGAGRLTLSPACLPYSPEFKPVEADEGPMNLERLARATEGKERTSLGAVWKDLPVRARFVELSPWLLALAILVFLLEVVERRTGLLSPGRALPKREREPTRQFAPAPGRSARLSWIKGVALSWKSQSPRSEDSPAQPAETTVQAKAAEQAGVVDALRRARSRASRRTKQGPPRAGPPSE
ncbi:MAG TPA: VWA domain-containing protein [Blastocatellia bacterium]|nr:VWA domain-containing protein [Blastocatellia bacterium]